MFKKALAILLVLVVAGRFVTAAGAQDGQPETPTDNDVNQVAKQLYCPVCPNTPLDVCETKACADWRQQIRNQLAEGSSEEEIINFFVDQYGPRVLAEPQRSGFTSMVWVLPVVVVLLGLILTWSVLRNWRRPEAETKILELSQRQVSQETINQIEQELQELD